MTSPGVSANYNNYDNGYDSNNEFESLFHDSELELDRNYTFTNTHTNTSNTETRSKKNEIHTKKYISIWIKYN